MGITYTAPDGLSVTPSTYSTLVLTWNDNETGVEAEVQRQPSGGTFQTIGIGLYNGTYTDSTCSANTLYTYRVRYYSGGDISEWSEEDRDYTYPSPPTGLAVTFSGKTATLTWTNGSTYDYIGVYYKLSADSTWTTSTSTLTGTLTTTTVASLTESVNYDFRIRGQNSTSALWSTYNTSSSNLSGVAAPTNLLLTSASTTSVTATWTDNSSVEDGYEVYHGTTLFETTAADATTSTITGLTAGTEYTIKVRAKDGTYYSAYATDTITTGVVPDAPPVAVAVVVVSQTALTPTWTCAATNEDGFTVYRSTDNATYTEIGTAAAGATSYADTGLSSYTTYYYKARAYNTYGVSALSSAMNNTTTIDLDPPTALIADALSSTQIKISFTINAGNATDHYVERKISGGSYSSIGSVGDGTTASYTDGTCSADTEYTYRIRAYNNVALSYGDYSVAVTKRTLAVGTDAVRRYETYFAMGNSLCVISETPQNSIAAYWRSKPLDFSEVDPTDADRFKTVYLVQLEYHDTYASVPIVVSLSSDGGTNWTTSTESVGSADGTDKVHNFYFAGVTGKYITLKIASTDTDTSFSWTGIIVHYVPRGEYMETS